MAGQSPTTVLLDRLAELGLTQAELAEKLGVSRPTIHSWVHGHEAAPRARRAQMSIFAHLPPSDLFDADGVAKSRDGNPTGTAAAG